MHITKTLDLGCGLQPKNPYNAELVFGIDVRSDAPGNILSADLAVEKIPFPNEHFDFVTAFDFLEHIPRVLYLPHRRNPFVELLNEIHRVLKKGGIFLSSTPAYPNASAFRDPTHVNIITDETFPLYFGDPRVAEQYSWASMYGFQGAFNVNYQEWYGASLVTVMKKVEPIVFAADESVRNLVKSRIKEALDLKNINKIDAANGILWEAHKDEPNNMSVLCLLSNNYFLTGQFFEGLRISEYGLNVNPIYPALRFVQGECLQALGRNEEALAAYRKALNIYPDYINVLLKSGLLLMELSRPEEALQRFDQALIAEPKNDCALKNRLFILGSDAINK